MASFEEIFLSAKGKQRVTLIAELLTSDKRALGQLQPFFQQSKAGDRALCLEALELVTRTQPKLAATCMSWVTEEIGSQAPAIQREASRVIANAAKEFPDEAAQAIPALLANTKNKGTVVRWSAALALAEIAKNNSKTRAKLVPLFEQLVAAEENSGVKNHYVKALKAIHK
jgi:hypothetical protein